MTIALPRFVVARRLKSGGTGYYWSPPSYWRAQAAAADKAWPFETQTLGKDLRQVELDAVAAPYNAQFDEWRDGGGESVVPLAAYGTVKWLLDTYFESTVFERRVDERSRPDYRRLFEKVCSFQLKTGARFGAALVATVTPVSAEGIYGKIVAEKADEAATTAARALNRKAQPVMTGNYRQGEKAIMYLKTAWRLMQPHHPTVFRADVPNPWIGVQLKRRTKAVKAAHGRGDVYTFAQKAIALGSPELGAAAVICFEWLQRPENVLAGYIRWPDYQRGRSVRLVHHKTGAAIEHPLVDADGTSFYAEAEAVLSHVPARGIPIVLRPDGTLYEPTRAAQIVRKIADAAGLPKTFNLDSCRHGGMTELEEAELTDGQGRALSMHKSRAYEGYAKRTKTRVLGATRKRIAHRNDGA